ncbi:14266_t:CDS:2, partial [Cetraspora pellucida]
HIFNNYEAINKELGGDIFLSSVAVTALGSEFKPEIDADFCAWLRDVKQLTVDKVKRRSYPCNSVEQLRQEYLQQLQKETELLDKHKRQLSKSED